MAMGQSVWNEQINIPTREPLKEDLSVEAVVIGAGITGILTAYFLQKAGMQVVVLEADRIASGQTGRTTAKITIQHGLCYHKLINRVGREEAADYMKANRLAVENYRKLVQELGIDCDFYDCDAYLYTQEENTLLEEEEKAAIQLGIDALLTDKTELPFPVKKALRFSNQATFHPLKFIRHLSDHLMIYEKTQVQNIEGHTVITDRGKVEAKHIVIACHYPFTVYPGYYFLRMHQERSYVAAIKNTDPIRNMYYGIDRSGFSFRQSGAYLLFGGAGHRTGENKFGGQYDRLLGAAGRRFPEGQVVSMWSAQDCMPLDDIPYIGQFSRGTKDVYVATGFKKWGMTHAMVAAQVLSEKILWGKASVGDVFRPERFHAGASMCSLMDEGTHAVKGLAKGYMATPEEKRCTHMGCQLSLNPEEKSWDCPCHGSRFTLEGKRIDGPARKDLPTA